MTHPKYHDSCTMYMYTQSNFLPVFCNYLIRSPHTLDIATNESDQNAIVRVDRFRAVEPAELRFSFIGFHYGNLLIAS